MNSAGPPGPAPLRVSWNTLAASNTTAVDDSTRRILAAWRGSPFTFPPRVPGRAVPRRGVPRRAGHVNAVVRDIPRGNDPCRTERDDGARCRRGRDRRVVLVQRYPRAGRGVVRVEITVSLDERVAGRPG